MFLSLLISVPFCSNKDKEKYLGKLDLVLEVQYLKIFFTPTGLILLDCCRYAFKLSIVSKYYLNSKYM